MSNSTELHREREDALRSALMARVAEEGTSRRRLAPTIIALIAGGAVAITAVTAVVVANAVTGSDGRAANPPSTSVAQGTLPSPSDPAPPTVTDAPFAIGTWELSNPAEVNVDSTTVHLNVTRISCSSGETGTVLSPEVMYETDRIVIRTPVAALPKGAYTCHGNNSVPLTVQLREPVGARQLVDGECLDEPSLDDTAFCLGGPVRWHP